MPTSQVKSEFRQLLAQRIKSISAVERSVRDTGIRARIADLRSFRDAEQVVAYVAFRDEPDLGPLMGSAVREGKRVLTPVVETDRGIRFSTWAPTLDEPHGAPNDRDAAVAVDLLEPVPSIVLIPGRGFDPTGSRLGRGRGWYDRALPQLRRIGQIVGVAYECQIVAAIPREPHDQPVDAVVTEKSVFYAVADRGRGS